MARPRKSKPAVKRAKARSPKRRPESESREPLVDARIRPLLERYVAIVGAELTNIADGLVELNIPASEQQWFQNRERIRIAFTLDALEQDPEAEIAVAGSPFTEQLIAAIRARGSRVSYGQLRPERAADAKAAALQIPVTNGSARALKVDVAWHRVVRLLARIVVRAGGEVEEHLLESGYLDATTGAPVPPEIATEIASIGSPRGGTGNARKPKRGATPEHEASRPTSDLISLATSDLRSSLESKVQRLRDEARGKLREELERLDSYYASLIADAASRGEAETQAAAQRAIEAEHVRRRSEEERRHQVRAIVHPVQLTECELLVQRAHWELIGNQDARATLIAERWLNGAGNWSVACPSCGATTLASLSLCRSGHVACDNCASACGACGEEFCREHGIAACHVDGRPTCDADARTCITCNEPYCSAHEATCIEGDHVACTECIAPCAVCRRPVCNEHATLTDASAPLGERRLCKDCVRVCEGGASEVLGSDEVTSCPTCDKQVCEHHSVPCAEDGAEHCRDHMLKLRREHGKLICPEHGATCHVDRGTYRARETQECPVCAKAACRLHLTTCGWCGRTVCLHDITGGAGRCRTCLQLRASAELPPNIADAVAAVLPARSSSKRWKMARDAGHTIVEVDLGWTRRVVLLVRHGETVATVGRTHSALNSKKLDRSA